MNPALEAAILKQHRMDGNPHPQYLLRAEYIPPTGGTSVPGGEVTTQWARWNHDHDGRYSITSHLHDDRYALKNHTHPLPPGYDGLRSVLEALDPKTGSQRFRIERFVNGRLIDSSPGPWHPYHEDLPSASEVVTPCTGTTAAGSHSYSHAANALTYIADEDNVALLERYITELVCDNEIAFASVAVAANAGATWFGTVLPIRFVNNRTWARRFAIQIHSPSGVPDGHKVSLGISNTREYNCQWKGDAPQSFDSKEFVQPDGGEITVWLFLGLGIVNKPDQTEAARVPYSVQVDAWFL
ncbi:hypothetical protein UFOVP141_10 [uncultured Caudovirales phage]|uniref:Uncharacterized protein n=1 Tax=uncultured Caudovirales phage TaxID=2100421 RepID=A0A6J7VM70_9CAUD|nr:hypothetical protein UFOVP141_10 [uncultured Caudovirales phage]